jgi:hypothetical protein
MRLYLLVLSIGLYGTSLAQGRETLTNVHVADSVPPTPRVKKGLFHIFSVRRDEGKTGKLLVTPFFLPAYSPDIAFSLAGGAIFSFKTLRSDTSLPESSIPVTVTYSSVHSFIASASYTLFFHHDQFRIYGLSQYKNTRDAFYGVGYDNAIATSYPDSTNFERSFAIVQVRPLWKVKKHFFGGLNLEYSQNILSHINPHMSHDPYYLETGQFIRNTGVGAILSYDSRDFPQNAYRGLYSTLIYTFYQKATGGNTDFRALDFDTRYFVPLSTHKFHGLAFNYRSRYYFGETPFTSMVSLGTSQDLRGLRFGQFRDFYENYFITEYRHKFYVHDRPTRWGFVVWGGVGSIGPDFRSALFERAIPSVGLGLRFEIQPRLNIRADFGYAPSQQESASYFNFLESF